MMLNVFMQFGLIQVARMFSHYIFNKSCHFPDEPIFKKEKLLKKSFFFWSKLVEMLFQARPADHANDSFNR